MPARPKVDEKTLRGWMEGWPGVGTDVKWGNDLCFLVAGKMFCVHCLDGEGKGSLSFKVEDARFLELTDRPGFVPAPYLARAHWVKLDDPSALARAELQALLRRAYELILARLPKKTQRELAG